MSFADDSSRWSAVRSRDARADGSFVYCVKTTKIFCRPICKARLARRSNVEFCDTANDAVAAGYRACKRCQPQLERFVPDIDKKVEKARRLLDNSLQDGKIPTLDRLSEEAGLTKYHFHRSFKKATGLTPREYALQRKQLHAIATNDDSAASTMSTPSMTHDTAISSVTFGTPDTAMTPSDVPFHWDQMKSNDLSILDDFNFDDLLDSETNFEFKTRVPNRNEYTAAASSNDSQIVFTTVETTYGILLIAFQHTLICHLELAVTLFEATTSLTKCFPSPPHSLLQIENDGQGQHGTYQQQVDAVVEALERPSGKRLDVQLPSSFYEHTEITTAT